MKKDNDDFIPIDRKNKLPSYLGRCRGCGDNLNDDEIIKINSHYYCQKCYEAAKQCEWCGCQFVDYIYIEDYIEGFVPHIDDEPFTTKLDYLNTNKSSGFIVPIHSDTRNNKNGLCLCEKCYEQTFVCEICGQLFKEDDVNFFEKTTLDGQDFSSGVLCHNCINKTNTCSFCGNDFKYGELFKIDDYSYLCERCSENMTTCCSCGALTEVNKDEEVHKVLCADCCADWAEGEADAASANQEMLEEYFTDCEDWERSDNEGWYYDDD